MHGQLQNTEPCCSEVDYISQGSVATQLGCDGESVVIT